MTSSLPLERQAPIRTRADRAALELVRIVVADGWTPSSAADELRVRVDGDLATLRLLRARVAKVMLQRPTRLGVRASITLERMLTRNSSDALLDPQRSDHRGVHTD